MSLATLSASQIRAQVSAIRNKFPQARIIGIKTNGRWTGGENLTIGDAEYRVAQCDSVLQIRETLLTQKTEQPPLVVVTNLDEDVLGQDLLARFIKRRLYSIQAWPILLELFQAKNASPALLSKKWLAEFLLEELPSQGFPAVASGTLDEETVWRIVLCDRMGFSTARPDARDLLAWTLHSQQIAVYQRTSEQIRQGVREWVAQSAGAAGHLIFDCLDSGYGQDAAAIGLACRVVFSDENRPELKEAAVRMERFTGNQSLNKTAAVEWARQSVALLEQIVSRGDGQLTREVLEKSDRILAELKIESYAWLSSHSPFGYEQRIERYAKQLLKCLKANNPSVLSDLSDRAAAIIQHQQSRLFPERLKRVEMSLRLLQWLGSNRENTNATSSFVQAAQLYVADGSFVDRARHSIARGDGNQPLAQAYQQLYRKVTEHRELQNEQFGKLLANWTELGSVGDGVLLIEEVVEKVVAKIAQHERVLLIVMDGMSYAVFHELIEDIHVRGWRMLAPKNTEWPLPVIAALPTVTEASRTSLLCGRLATGNSSTEVTGFKINPALAKFKPGPVLFHKGNLTTAGSSDLAHDVIREIESERRKVVGVVVNAIDDHLAKGEQTNIPWTLHHLPALEHLLRSAWDSGRVVILTSDHGHILERDTTYQKLESGERYRVDDGAPQKDELLISGARVLLLPDHRMIAPWAENVRYGKKKHGYHGGISPQECIVPLAILTHGNVEIKGWVPLTLKRPG